MIFIFEDFVGKIWIIGCLQEFNFLINVFFMKFVGRVIKLYYIII